MKFRSGVETCVPCAQVCKRSRAVVTWSAMSFASQTRKRLPAQLSQSDKTCSTARRSGRTNKGIHLVYHQVSLSGTHTRICTRMYACLCVCTYEFVNICMVMYVFVRLHACMHVSMFACVNLCELVCMTIFLLCSRERVFVSVIMCVCSMLAVHMYACMYVCMHACIRGDMQERNIYVYIYI